MCKMVVSRASNPDFFSSPDEILVAQTTHYVLSHDTNWSPKVLYSTFHLTIPSAKFIIVCDADFHIFFPLASRAIKLGK